MSESGSGSGSPVRVFISYAHDSAEHEDRVREFWLFLRASGIDGVLDLPAAERRLDWSLWMLDEVRKAQFVLVVVSPEYRRRADGEAASDEGRGVQFEAALIREEVYRDRSAALNRFLPVLLPGGSPDDIPVWLGPVTSSHFVVPEFTVAGAERLLRLLTGQPLETTPDLGPVPVLSVRSLAPPSAASSRTLAGDRAAWWRGGRLLVLVSIPLLAASGFLPLRGALPSKSQGTNLPTVRTSGFTSAPVLSPVPSQQAALTGGPGTIGTAPDRAGHESGSAPPTTPTSSPQARTTPSTGDRTVTLQPIKWIKVTATEVTVVPDRDPASDFEIEYNAVDPMHPGTVSYPNTDGTCTTPANSAGRGIDPDATVTLCGTTRDGRRVKLRISKDPANSANRIVQVTHLD